MKQKEKGVENVTGWVFKLSHPARLRQWPGEAMHGTMKAVWDGTLGVNRAALEFGVPRTMLKDRVSGRVIPKYQPW